MVALLTPQTARPAALPEDPGQRRRHLQLVPEPQLRGPEPLAPVSCLPTALAPRQSSLQLSPSPRALSPRPLSPHSPQPRNVGPWFVAAVCAAVVCGVLISLARPAPPADTWAEVQASVVGAGASPATGEATLVVQPGDTLWDLAQRLAPGSDTRQIVGLLERRNGSSQLNVGQVLIIPAGLAGGR